MTEVGFLLRASRRLRRAPVLVVLAVGAVGGAVTSAPGQEPARVRCDLCHGELEFLRQRVATREAAEALLAPADTLAASAHGSMGCSDCHRGYEAFPHDEEAGATTACATCHEGPRAEWDEGLHAAGEAVGATCSQCHGTHDVVPTTMLASVEEWQATRARCESCHGTSRLPGGAPHERLPCTSCHEAHRTQRVEDIASNLAPTKQASTCGTCHEPVAAAWREDAHGTAVLALDPAEVHVLLPEEEHHAPTCTSCHGAHPVLGRSAPGFGTQMTQTCQGCHEHYAESFADSYHGQASALGYEAVAACADCHGAHGVFPAEDARSTVSESRLLDTCRGCHPDASANFTGFAPHADHNDRERFPYVYWSYRLMTGLLVAVFTVFGIHTLLWLARLALDALRRPVVASATEGSGDPRSEEGGS